MYRFIIIVFIITMTNVWASSAPSTCQSTELELDITGRKIFKNDLKPFIVCTLFALPGSDDKAKYVSVGVQKSGQGKPIYSTVLHRGDGSIYWVGYSRNGELSDDKCRVYAYTVSGQGRVIANLGPEAGQVDFSFFNNTIRLGVNYCYYKQP